MTSLKHARKKSVFDDSSDEEESIASSSNACKNDEFASDIKDFLNEDEKEIFPSKKFKTDEETSSGSQKVDFEEPEIVLTPAMRARIEHNRQKALMIRQEKMNRYLPPDKKKETSLQEGQKVVRINDVKLIDSGGGFYIEDQLNKDKETEEKELKEALKKTEEPAPLIEEDRPTCIDCSRKFDSSFLMKHFGHSTCDDCRDNDKKHALLTKTDARNDYQLQDVDLDKRDPPLRYILRKNPHNERWGDMKLYLKIQVEKRCLEVWGSEEALEEAIAKKEQQREASKQKKFKKKMQELRMNVRSSLYTRATKSHEHEYGEEEYIEEDDEYCKTCATCGHSYRYDKL